MHEDLTDLVRKLLQLFIKPDVLTKCTSATALKLLNLMKNENFLSGSKSNIGFATKFTVSEIIRKDLVTDTELGISPLGIFTISHGQDSVERGFSIPSTRKYGRIDDSFSLLDQKSPSFQQVITLLSGQI